MAGIGQTSQSAAGPTNKSLEIEANKRCEITFQMTAVLSRFILTFSVLITEVHMTAVNHINKRLMAAIMFDDLQVYLFCASNLLWFIYVFRFAESLVQVHCPKFPYRFSGKSARTWSTLRRCTASSSVQLGVRLRLVQLVTRCRTSARAASLFNLN